MCGLRGITCLLILRSKHLRTWSAHAMVGTRHQLQRMLARRAVCAGGCTMCA